MEHGKPGINSTNSGNSTNSTPGGGLLRKSCDGEFSVFGDDLRMLCEVCQKQRAVCHITNCAEGKTSTRNLCAECYERTLSAEEVESQQKFNAELKTAACKYCGEPAVGGSGASMPFLDRLPDGASFGFLNAREFWCEECQRDLTAFAQLPPKDGNFDGDMKRLALDLADRVQRKEAFMKEQVALRARK
jgi:hypothetical protein